MTELEERVRLYLDQISPPLGGNASLTECSMDLNRLAVMIARILKEDLMMLAAFNRVLELLADKSKKADLHRDPAVRVNGVYVIDAIIELLPSEGMSLWSRRISLQP